MKQNINLRKFLFLPALLATSLVSLTGAAAAATFHPPGEAIHCALENRVSPNGPMIRNADGSEKTYEQILAREPSSQFIAVYSEELRNSERFEKYSVVAEHVMRLLERELVSTVPITVEFGFRNLGSSTGASARPIKHVTDFENAPFQDVEYPIALANALAGRDLDPSKADISVSLNSAEVIDSSISFAIDGNVPDNKYNLVAILLHEVAHGLGILGNGNNVRIFNHFFEDEAEVKESDQSREESRIAHTWGETYFGGEFARAGNRGRRVPLYTPPRFSLGSSLSHVIGTRSIMNPAVLFGDNATFFDLTTLGILKDMGWQLNDSTAFPIVITGNKQQIEIEAGATKQLTFEVANVSNEPVELSATVSSSNDYLKLLCDPVQLVQPGEKADFTVELLGPADNGFYVDEMMQFASSGTDAIATVDLDLKVTEGNDVVRFTHNFPKSLRELLGLRKVDQGYFVRNLGLKPLDFQISSNAPTNFTSLLPIGGSQVIAPGGRVFFDVLREGFGFEAGDYEEELSFVENSMTESRTGFRSDMSVSGAPLPFFEYEISQDGVEIDLDKEGPYTREFTISVKNVGNRFGFARVDATLYYENLTEGLKPNVAFGNKPSKKLDPGESFDFTLQVDPDKFYILGFPGSFEGRLKLQLSGSYQGEIDIPFTIEVFGNRKLISETKSIEFPDIESAESSMNVDREIQLTNIGEIPVKVILISDPDPFTVVDEKGNKARSINFAPGETKTLIVRYAAQAGQEPQSGKIKFLDSELLPDLEIDVSSGTYTQIEGAETVAAPI